MSSLAKIVAWPLLLPFCACVTATTLQMPGAERTGDRDASEALLHPQPPVIEGITDGVHDGMLSFTLSGEPGSQLKYTLNGGITWRDYNGEVVLADPGLYLVQTYQLNEEGNGSELTDIIRLVILHGDILLPPFVSNGMVLQRNVEVPIFGYCKKVDDVTVTFRGASVTARCVNDEWQAWLPRMAAGGPWPLTVEGNNTRVIENVYVGDVWLAAGQSNMGEESSFGPDQFDDTDIHIFHQSTLQESNTGWRSTAEPFVSSTVATHFARWLQPHIGVPVGIILAAEGSTPLAWWHPSLSSGVGGQEYRFLIQPIQPYPISGVLWWQGESDALSGSAVCYGGEMSCPEMYSEHFAGMITGWRDAWDIGEIPFLFVQMQRVSYPDVDLSWPLVRQGQLEALSLNNTGMVVSFDLTDGDLHPTNKEPIAARLALAARAIAYGESLDYSGPVFEAGSVDGNRVTLTFDHADGGLVVAGDMLSGFEVVDRCEVYSVTDATVQGDGVLITVEGLAGPVRIRYGWRNDPEGNLYNSAALPASPFITEPIELKGLLGRSSGAFPSRRRAPARQR